MNRAKIKAQARELIDGKLWELWKPMLLIGLISIPISILFYFLNPSLTYITELSSGEAFSYNFGATLISFIFVPFNIGYMVYLLNFIRGKKTKISDIFSTFKHLLPILGVVLLTNILAGLGSLFFIFPGIIISLAFAMVYYLLADGEYDVDKVLSKSVKMMDGYKWNFFVFGLSFIGWILLGIITFGIAFIYISPYISVSYALYYEELKKKQAKD